MAHFARLFVLLCTGAVLASVGLLPAAASAASASRKLTRDVRTTRVSTSRCSVTASSESAAQSAQAASNLTSLVEAFICDPNGELSGVTAQAASSAIASAEATGFARAVASVSVDCALEGNVRIRINGQSMAMAQASLITALFVEGVAKAAVCERCSVTAALFAERVSEVLLDAVAMAEVNILETSTGGRREIVERVFVEDIVSGSALSVAEVLVTAVADLDNVCSTNIELTGSFDGNTGDDAAPEPLACLLNSSTTSATFQQAAVASATNALAEFACEDPSVDRATTVATDIATAVALVVANLTADCNIQFAPGETGAACAQLTAKIVDSAEAAALAFAMGVAEAMSSCDPPLCDMNMEDMESTFMAIIAEATTNAMAGACTNEGTGMLNVTMLSTGFVAMSAEAIATLLLEARVDGLFCDVFADANATISPIPPAPIPPLTALVPPFPSVPTATSLGTPARVTPSTSTTTAQVNTILITPTVPANTTATVVATANSPLSATADVARA
eukprot:jgi/Ulvmu1/12613/UM093_0005.1